MLAWMIVNFLLFASEKPAAVVYPDYRRSEKGRTSLVSIGRGKLVIPQGKLIRLMCHVRGSPTPKVTWLKDHDIVRKSSRHHIDGQQLVIESARQADVGTYVCIAENVMGATSALSQISIGGKCSYLGVTFVLGRNFWHFFYILDRIIQI